jgi:hypothetical protein
MTTILQFGDKDRSERAFYAGELNHQDISPRVGLGSNQAWALAAVIGTAASALQNKGWPRRATLVASAMCAGMSRLKAGSMAADLGCEEKHQKVELHGIPR